MKSLELHAFWRRWFRFDWKFGLCLLLFVCSVRFFLVLRVNETGNYNLLAYVMGFSALTPFIFLSAYGRKKIGFSKPLNYGWLFYSLLIGMMAAGILFVLGYVLYADTQHNWYAYIGRSYLLPEGITAQDKLIYFLIYVVTGMLVSPVGEELFFKGIVHRSFARQTGDWNASYIDSAAFAFTHLSHFGIVYLAGAWTFLPVASLLWTIGMFCSCQLFFWCKKKTGSLAGAVLSHSGFNLMMIYSIFYWL